jgi:hypothetical protein
VRLPVVGVSPSSGFRRILRTLMVTVDEVREFAERLPRSYEAVVRGHLKLRVGRIVYVAFSRDETLMGFGFPKEFRQALVDSEPEKFLMPGQSDMRYNWAVVRLAAIDGAEMRDLVLDAWAMCVPKSVAAAYRAQ